MKRSEHRFLTTHAGSLTRPPGLAEFSYARQQGDIDESAYLRYLAQSVATVVKGQAEAGVDVVNDGEFGKSTSWSLYALKRLTGFELRPAEPGTNPFTKGAERKLFREFYEDPAADALEDVVAAARVEVPDLLVVQPTTMARMRDHLLLPLSLGGIVAVGLGSLALLLSVLGLSGLIIYWVSRRTREIGLRMALGAGRSSVLRLVGGHAFALIGVGLILGSVGSVAIGRLLSVVLYVPAFDAVSLSIGVAVILIGGVLASIVPARRATSIEPMTALRRD